MRKVLTPAFMTRVAAALLFICVTSVIALPQTLTFAVAGDIGDEGDIPAIAGQMAKYRQTKGTFEFVLLLGDNIYSDGLGKGLKKHFEDPFKELLDGGVKFYAVLGNHDIRKGLKAQIDYPNFNMGGRRFYSFKMGDNFVEFFALDSTSLAEEAEDLVEENLKKLQKTRDVIDKSLTVLRTIAPTAGEKAQMTNQEKKLAITEARILEAEEFLKETRTAKSEQLDWLETALANSTARWKVVFLHHAIYSSAYKRFPLHGHGKDKTVLALRDLLKDKFMQNRVDVVFAGHDHVFEKTKIQKSATTGHQITYITSGAASELREGDLDKKKSPFFEFGEDSQHSFLVVRVNNNDMQIDVVNRKGENIFPRFWRR